MSEEKLDEKTKKLIREYEANKEFAKRGSRSYDIWERNLSRHSKKQKRKRKGGS